MIDVFIGLDRREAVAWHVCTQSILDTSKRPDEIAFHAVTGERRDGSNSFVYARFLVPYLCGFKGSALFVDGDMIFRAPIEDLWDLRAAGNVGVQLVKHDYKTKYPVKYLGAKNEDYPRKNWSSVVLWNCGFFPNRALTPEFVSQASGAYLHHFEWLADHQIGELPKGWNHLTMEQEPDPDASLLHYTIGIPPFYPVQEGADEWRQTLANAIRPYANTDDLRNAAD